MIKVENIEVWGFEHAIRGMRNPKASWSKSDSKFYCREETVDIGPNDLKLMRSLFSGGPEHRKYMRQIFVSMDITAPLYMWKEMDQYRIGVTTDSCSTMHKIHAKEFTIEDFSHENLIADWGYDNEEDLVMYNDEYGNTALDVMLFTVSALNVFRNRYLETKDKKYWWQLIQLLPSSYNQRRTITMNYENVVNMIRQREFHKLDEWREFVKVLRGLPYLKEIMGDK